MSKINKLVSVQQTPSDWNPERADVLRLVWSRKDGKRLMELEQVAELCRVFWMDPWSVITSTAIIARDLSEIRDIAALHADIVEWLCRTPRDVLAHLLSDTDDEVPDNSIYREMREEFRRAMSNDLPHMPTAEAS